MADKVSYMTFVSKVDRLPPLLRPPARAARALRYEFANRRPRRRYVYKSDGFATEHYTPFLEDDLDFQRVWDRIQPLWHDGTDNRWRLWLLAAFARSAPDGAFAEFGTWRGGCAYTVLTLDGHRREAWLFDTYAGIPADRLSRQEGFNGFAKRYADTTPDRVRDLLSPWKDQVTLVAGDVFETTITTELPPVAVAHLDLNAAAPTVRAMEFVWSRLVDGAVVVFDDYGWRPYADQRREIDRFLAGRGLSAIPLPTGQAIAMNWLRAPA